MSAPAQSVGRSGAVMAAGTLVSRVLGLVRTSLLASVLGISGVVADAFSAANTLPNSFYLLLAGGAVQAVLVPQIIRARNRRDGDDFVNRIVTVSIVFFGVATVLLTALAPLIVRIFYSPDDAQAVRLAVVFAVICMPQLFFYGMYTVLGQVLTANGRFAAFTWAPALANVVAVAGLLWFRAADLPLAAPPGAWTPQMVAILAGTATLSIAVQCAGLLPALHRMGFRYRWLWGVRGYGLGEIFTIGKWTIGSIVVQQLGFIVTSRVLTRASALGSASGTDVPGLFAFTNAQFIVLLPHGLVTVSLVTALYTKLSEAASVGDDRAVVRYHDQGMRMPSVFLVPGVAFAFAFAPLLASTIFFGNTLAQTAAVATVLYGVLWLVIPMGWGFLNDRVLYAQTQTYLTFRIQVVVTSTATLVTLLAATLDPGRTAVVVGLGQSFAYLVGSVIGFAILRRQHGSLGLRSTAVTYLKLAVPSAVVAALLALAVGAVFPDIGTTRGVTALVTGGLVLGVAGAVQLAVVWALAHLLGVREVSTTVEPVARRLRRLRRG
ncbi:MAG TPA: lipid II flippase MurJ [Phycicoccus sp.]|nr:lipid II flippase MurJ [Phycicoccus sp.]